MRPNSLICKYFVAKNSKNKKERNGIVLRSGFND